MLPSCGVLTTTRTLKYQPGALFEPASVSTTPSLCGSLSRRLHCGVLNLQRRVTKTWAQGSDASAVHAVSDIRGLVAARAPGRPFWSHGLHRTGIILVRGPQGPAALTAPGTGAHTPRSEGGARWRTRRRRPGTTSGTSASNKAALAGAPPADVSRAGAAREAPPGPGAGAEPDLGRASQPPGEGRALRSGVGKRAGGVGVPPERGGRAGAVNDSVELAVTGRAHLTRAVGAAAALRR